MNNSESADHKHVAVDINNKPYTAPVCGMKINLTIFCSNGYKFFLILPYFLSALISH